jgi:hypothetical protein
MANDRILIDHHIMAGVAGVRGIRFSTAARPTLLGTNYRSWDEAVMRER